jgi:N-acetylglutamate synthase-like GNAT family acetyltransferase
MVSMGGSVKLQVKKATLEDLGTTYCCAKEFPPDVEWVKYLPESREWFKTNLGKHIEGYHLLDEDKVVGLIYWARSEKALLPYIIEPSVACIYCTELLRDYKHKGYGRMMLDYMKADLKQQGFKGILVPATDIEVYMHYKDFQKHGFQIIKEHPPFKIMYYPLTKKNITIKIIELNYKPATDKVEVTLFSNFMCPVGAYMFYMIKKVAESFGDKVKIVEMDTTLETVRKFGTTEPLINGKMKFWGPVLEKTVKNAIQEEIN